MTQYPPIAEFLPHRGPMVLLDAMTRWAEGEAECSLRVRETARFVVEGRVESAVTIEYMAQAVAACLGYEAVLNGGAVRSGMIIACKTFTAHADALQVGDELRVHVRRIRGSDTLSHFEGSVHRGDALYSQAVLTLYHAEQPPDLDS